MHSGQGGRQREGPGEVSGARSQKVLSAGLSSSDPDFLISAAGSLAGLLGKGSPCREVGPTRAAPHPRRTTADPRAGQALPRTASQFPASLSPPWNLEAALVFTVPCPQHAERCLETCLIFCLLGEPGSQGGKKYKAWKIYSASPWAQKDSENDSNHSQPLLLHTRTHLF